MMLSLALAVLLSQEVYPPRMSPRFSMQGVYRVASDVQQDARRRSQETQQSRIRRVRIGLSYRKDYRGRSYLPAHPGRQYRYHTGRR